jgi:PAS domain S-box-containing protein
MDETVAPADIRILLVDDEPGLVAVAADLLEREDGRFVVETAASAEAGLERIAEGEFDCIVSDYDMPGRNGIEFLRAVRADDPDLPFILFTGKGSEEVASDAISAGVTDYLQKETGTDQYAVLANRIANVVAQTHAERELREQKRRFRLLFDRLSQAAVEVEYVDGVPIVQQANSVFGDVFGYDVDELVGDSLDEYIVPGDRTEEAAPINQHVQSGGCLDSVEVTRCTADGEREFLLQNAVYDDGSGGFAIYTDITKRQKRRERYEEFLEHSSDIITVLDPDGTYQYQSQSSERILGYDPEALLGDDVFEYVHPDDRSRLIERFEHAVANPEVTPNTQYRFRHADGSWLWLESIGKNQLDNPGI